MKLTHHDFYILFSAAIEMNDRDFYINERRNSSIFYPDPEEPCIDPDELYSTLANIWDVAHLTVRAIREHMGLSQGKFSERFCVPVTTAKNWDAGRRQAPPYLILLFAKEAGMLHADVEE